MAVWSPTRCAIMWTAETVSLSVLEFAPMGFGCESGSPSFQARQRGPANPFMAAPDAAERFLAGRERELLGLVLRPHGLRPERFQRRRLRSTSESSSSPGRSARCASASSPHSTTRQTSRDGLRHRSPCWCRSPDVSAGYGTEPFRDGIGRASCRERV